MPQARSRRHSGSVEDDDRDRDSDAVARIKDRERDNDRTALPSFAQSFPPSGGLSQRVKVSQREIASASLPRTLTLEKGGLRFGQRTPRLGSKEGSRGSCHVCSFHMQPPFLQLMPCRIGHPMMMMEPTTRARLQHHQVPMTVTSQMAAQILLGRNVKQRPPPLLPQLTPPIIEPPKRSPEPSKAALPGPNATQRKSNGLGILPLPPTPSFANRRGMISSTRKGAPSELTLTPERTQHAFTSSYYPICPSSPG